MTRRNYLPTPLAGLVFILSFIAYLIAAGPVLGNIDMAWHLAAGDFIREHGIPSLDPWSFSAGDTPWYNISWLWDILISCVVSAGGLMGLYIFNAFCGALILGCHAYLLKRRGIISDLYILLTMLLTWYVMLAYLSPLPWLATFLFAIIFHHCAHASRSSARALYVLPPLMALWVNLHGGFIAGLSVLGFYIIEAQQTKQHAWLRQLLICAFACLLACLINPYGIHIIDAVLGTMDTIIQPYLAYWQPVNIGGDASLTLYLLIFIVVSNLREPRLRVADKLLIMSWLMYGLLTRRNFILFALFAAPYVAYCAQELARYAQGAKFKTISTLIADSSKERLRMALAVAGVVLLTIFLPPQPFLVPPEKLDADPLRLEPAMEQLLPLAKTHRFMNDFNIGAQLIYASGGTWPVFIDPRNGTAYSEQVLKDAMMFYSLLPGYEEVLVKHHIGGIIVSASHRFVTMQEHAPHSPWKKIYESDTVVAYLRKEKP